jgi:hypothetical protein
MHAVVHVLEELLDLVAHLRFGHHEMAPHVDDLRDVLDVHGALLLARAASAAAPELLLRDGGPESLRLDLAEERTPCGFLRGGGVGGRTRADERRTDLAEVLLHVANQLSRAECHSAHVGGADVFAASAVRTGVEIQQALPGVLLDPLDAEGLQGVRVVLQGLLDVGVGEATARLEIAGEYVEQPVEDVGELSEDQIADEHEGGDGVEPPQAAVEGAQAVCIRVREQQGDRVTARRPARELRLVRELGQCDADPLDEKALYEDQHQQQQSEPVVQRGVDVGGPDDRSAPQRHQDSHDAQDPEGIAHQRVPEVEGSLQEVDPGPLLQRDEARRDREGEECVEDEQVCDAGERVAKQPSVTEDLGEQSRDPLPQPVEAGGLSAEAPELHAAPDSVSDQADGDGGERVDERPADDVPVDLARRCHAGPPCLGSQGRLRSCDVRNVYRTRSSLARIVRATGPAAGLRSRHGVRAARPSMARVGRLA